MSDAAGEPGDDAHRRPDGVGDDAIDALGRVSEAWEYTVRARGHLYAFHQLTGSADRILHDAVAMLRNAGHHDAAAFLAAEIAGRNVIPGHWTFQIVEEYDDTYYRPFADAEQRLRDDLVGGRRHLREAELKRRLRTRGHPDHTWD
ncbi:hypothetical protein ACPA54_25880 [Uniformispora flossi]|uniref:hypothetical protein n=1 Tax=Uniformispora flossi TaxID=3390723 RepID=UPI003C2EA7C3